MGSSSTDAEPLFNEKVIFPLLEKLRLHGMDYITEIWDKQSIAVLKEQGSFCQLMDVKVSNCAQLAHVFHSKMHALLKNLKELAVRKCGTMEVIVEFEGEIDEDGLKNEVCFSKLRTLKLWYLPNLVSFCTDLTTAGTQPLFIEKFAFPALEELFMADLPNVIEIWEEKPLPESEKETQSFCKLWYIEIGGCNELVYVLPSYMLPQLQNLHTLSISFCEEMEVIVSKELKEKEVSDNDIIVFDQLKEVTFQGLPKLKSFYDGTELLFSHKVALPSLERLTIFRLPKIKEIWPSKQLLPEPGKEAVVHSWTSLLLNRYFYKLLSIRVEDCDQLVYVFPSYMLPRLQHLEEVAIEYCKDLEVIVSKELKEKEVIRNDIVEVIHNGIVFPQLKAVYLWSLPNLKRFCTETQLFFYDKDAFPLLWNIKLDDDLEFLRNGTSPKEVSMEECGTSGKQNDHNGEDD